MTTEMAHFVADTNYVPMRYRCERLELDWSKRELRFDGESTHVEPKVLALLQILLSNANRVVTRAELQKALWPDVTVGPDALNRLVRCARSVIQDDGPEPRLLLTRRGHGFVFTGTVECGYDTSLTGIKPAGNRVHGSTPCSSLADETTAPDRELAGSQWIIHWLVPRRRITLLPPTPTLLGRSPNCQEVLDGAGVSREHALCAPQGPVVVLRDLASRNGTYVNGRPVTETPLSANDSVRVGDWLGIVRRMPSTKLTSFERLGQAFHGGHDLQRLIGLAGMSTADRGPLNIWGERGVGKSALAKAIHEVKRPNGKLVTVQCRKHAAQPESTGQFEFSLEDVFQNASLLEASRSGTLVLDNIDALSQNQMESLAKLTADRSRQADEPCLVVTTSEVSLTSLVTGTAAGAGLPWQGVELVISPLRTRRSDVLELTGVFLRASNDAEPLTLSSRAAECLALYSWPLNVAELRNVVRQLPLRRASSGRLEPQDLPPELLRTAEA